MSEIVLLKAEWFELCCKIYKVAREDPEDCAAQMDKVIELLENEGFGLDVVREHEEGDR